METLKYILALCLCFEFTCIGVAFGRFDDVVQPSFGDVRLEYVPVNPNRNYPPPNSTSGRLLIYFTNGGTGGEWGSVSTYFPGNPDKPYAQVARTACRMLGQSDALHKERTAGDHPTNASRVWMHNVSCPEDANNILQCNYSVYNNESIGNKISHSEDYYIVCTGEQKAYPGQVRLCRPDQVPEASTTNPLQQISFGVMQYYDTESNSDTWRNIVDDDSSDTTISLTTLDVDTFCQQIGYSHAVIDSALRVSAISNFNFTKCDIGSHSYKTSEISCPSSIARPCFSCCVPRKLPQCDVYDCPLDKSVVIRCISDVFARNFPETGNQTACESLSSSSAAQCVKVPASQDDTLEIVALVFAVLFSVSFWTYMCYILISKCKRRLKNRPGEGEQLLNASNNNSG